MVRAVTINEVFVQLGFLGNLEECCLQLLLVLGYAYGIDNSHDDVGDFVCPTANKAFYLYFHIALFYGLCYAVALCAIILIFFCIKASICSWYSVFLLHTPRLCTTFIVSNDTSMVSMRSPSFVAEKISDCGLL